MITALDHIQIAMPQGSEDVARAFYGALLGLEEIPKPEGLSARGGCWFRGPGFALHLGIETPFAPQRKAHPAFRVRDLAAARTAFEAAGVSITDDASVPHVRRFYINDPFGSRIEIIQDGDRF